MSADTDLDDIKYATLLKDERKTRAKSVGRPPNRVRSRTLDSLDSPTEEIKEFEETHVPKKLPGMIGNANLLQELAAKQNNAEEEVLIRKQETPSWLLEIKQRRISETVKNEAPEPPKTTTTKPLWLQALAEKRKSKTISEELNLTLPSETPSNIVLEKKVQSTIKTATTTIDQTNQPTKEETKQQTTEQKSQERKEVIYANIKIESKNLNSTVHDKLVDRDPKNIDAVNDKTPILSDKRTENSKKFNTIHKLVQHLRVNPKLASLSKNEEEKTPSKNEETTQEVKRSSGERAQIKAQIDKDIKEGNFYQHIKELHLTDKKEETIQEVKRSSGERAQIKAQLDKDRNVYQHKKELHLNDENVVEKIKNENILSKNEKSSAENVKTYINEILNKEHTFPEHITKNPDVNLLTRKEKLETNEENKATLKVEIERLKNLSKVDNIQSREEILHQHNKTRDSKETVIIQSTESKMSKENLKMGNKNSHILSKSPPEYENIFYKSSSFNKNKSSTNDENLSKSGKQTESITKEEPIYANFSIQSSTKKQVGTVSSVKESNSKKEPIYENVIAEYLTEREASKASNVKKENVEKEADRAINQKQSTDVTSVVDELLKMKLLENEKAAAEKTKKSGKTEPPSMQELLKRLSAVELRLQALESALDKQKN